MIKHMHGKIKLVRKIDDRYYLFFKNWFWERWRPFIDNSTGKQLSFKDFDEFRKTTRIECFNTIFMQIKDFSGYREN